MIVIHSNFLWDSQVLMDVWVTETCTLCFYWSCFKRKTSKLENGYISSSVLKNIEGICIGAKEPSKGYSLCQIFSLDQIEEVLIKHAKFMLNIKWYISLFKSEYKESSAFKNGVSQILNKRQIYKWCTYVFREIITSELNN